MSQMIMGIPNTTPLDLRFRLFGVATRTHPLFWLMAALIGHSFAGDDLARIAIAAVCIFVSILVHEFGHALSGRYFGDVANYVVLYVMGGLCVPTRQLRHAQRIWMILWGPLAGFILAGATFGIVYGVRQGYVPYSESLALMLEVLLYVNIAWGIFNLLPVYPLDGGQILHESLMWKKPNGGEALAFLISMLAAMATAVGMGIYCSLAGMQPPIFMMVMMLYFAFQSWQLRQRVLEYGSIYGDSREAEEPRAAWEQDPDWWKKG